MLPTFTVPESEAQARAVQDSMRDKLILHDDFDMLEVVAGIDVGYDIVQNLAKASVVTMRLDDLQPIEQIQSFAPSDFPYIPGLLSFREIPAILTALSELKTPPDLLMVDGQGIAHPRRMGIAAHLGVLMDMPSIGVAKSRLTGRFQMPGEKKGSRSALMAGNQAIGVVLRSRDNIKPLFISPGHRISIETAVSITQRCLTRYRLPEPTRVADKYSKFRKDLSSLA